MSFTMNDIKIKKVTTRDKVVDCLRYLRDNDKLTENVRYALQIYTKYRFKNRCNSFTSNRLRNLTEDLLEHCCGKDYNIISVIDVSINESEMLYEIKRAILYGATKCLYRKDGDIAFDIDIPKLTTRQLQKKGIIDDYFGDITI